LQLAIAAIVAIAVTTSTTIIVDILAALTSLAIAAIVAITVTTLTTLVVDILAALAALAIASIADILAARACLHCSCSSRLSCAALAARACLALPLLPSQLLQPPQSSLPSLSRCPR
jgi:hypothetical protein